MRPRTSQWKPDPPPLAEPAPNSGPPRTQPVQSVPRLDLQRYAGRWHEIARLPMSFQRRCDGEVTATYRLEPDGTVAVHNACRTAQGRMLHAEGVARQPRPRDEPARLQVRFAPAWLGWLPWVWADYWVIALDDEYQWAMVGEPRRRYLWILSREPRMERSRLDQLRGLARRMGYDLAPLIVADRQSGRDDTARAPTQGW